MESRPAFPGFALALGLTWLLTGAMYKLFDGAVGDLPKTVLENSPFDPFNTFRYAIAAELAVVGLVIALPRIGWLALAGTYATFLAALLPLHLEGVESCGCMGGSVKIAPWQMMTVDGILLLLILVSRPWRLPKGAGLGAAAALVLMGAGVAAPLLKIEPEAAPAELTQEERDQRLAEQQARVEAAKAATGAAATETEDPAVPAAAVDDGQDVVVDDVSDPDTPAVEAEPTAAEGEVPAETAGLPQFMQLDFQSWPGQEVFVLPWYDIADQSMGAVMPGSHVVVYRQQCDVCKKHLEDLTEKMRQNDPEWAGKDLVLLRITEASDTEANNVCTLLPDVHQKVTLPALERGYLVTTPFSFDVNEEFVVSEVQDVRAEIGETK